MFDYMLQNSPNYFCLINNLFRFIEYTILIQRKITSIQRTNNFDSTNKIYLSNCHFTNKLFSFDQVNKFMQGMN